MGQEIERKYLVKGQPWKQQGWTHKGSELFPAYTMTQGYLCKSRNMTVRIRVTDSNALITVKGKRVNLACPEYEYDIPYKDGLELLALSVTPVVKKTRRVWKDLHDQTWEIDVFYGINKGLIMAEIELQSPDQQLILPSWIGAEVSYDKRYVNTYLAEHEVPKQL